MTRSGSVKELSYTMQYACQAPPCLHSMMHHRQLSVTSSCAPVDSGIARACRTSLTIAFRSRGALQIPSELIFILRVAAPHRFQLRPRLSLGA